jgi:hypothetical protein
MNDWLILFDRRVPVTDTIDEIVLNDLIGKVIGDVAGAMSLFMAYLGDQAGVFRALDNAGRLTVDELAAKLGLNPKYLHEWLGSARSARRATSNITPRTGLSR